LLVAIAAPAETVVRAVVIASLVLLAVLGALGAKAGGANLIKGVTRVMMWGALALAITAGVGRLFGGAF
jgi:VIT1/CCC1 family predicted Fe2+/Mn2+ transporter